MPHSSQFATRHRDLALPVKNKAKKALSTSSFSMQFVTRSFLACLHYLAVSLHFPSPFFQGFLPVETLLVTLYVPWWFQPQPCVAFLIRLLHAWVMLLDFLVACHCFHFLHTSFLCLSSARNSLFSQPGLLPYLPIFFCNHDDLFLCFKEILFEDQLYWDLFLSWLPRDSCLPAP